MKELLRSTTAYRTLCADVAREELSHASLVIFPDEKYLRRLLRECAKAIFGVKDGSRESELLEGEAYTDCLYFPTAGGKLTVADGAKIVEESLLRPVEGNKKLFVLDAFHSATPLVQNKLLKILEEPPQGVYFLLGATSEFGILPTVLSRVSKLSVPPFSEEAVKATLDRTYGRESGNVRAAAACGGIYSSAEALRVGGGEDFALAEEFLRLSSMQTMARKIGERKEKRPFLAALSLTLRDMLFYRTGQEGYVSLKGASLRALAMDYPVGALLKAQELVTAAEKEIKFNANYGQCLLSLALGIEKEKLKWQKLS